LLESRLFTWIGLIKIKLTPMEHNCKKSHGVVSGGISHKYFYFKTVFSTSFEKSNEFQERSYLTLSLPKNHLGLDKDNNFFDQIWM